jgi:hypothetical protein
MTYLENYLNSIRNNEIRQTVTEMVKAFNEQIQPPVFSYMNRISGLLLGEVQSGKTGQMLGIIADAADKGFDVFVVLTTDNSRLQEQTYERTFDAFSGELSICDEGHTKEFRMYAKRMRKPIIIVLKKNTKILTNWRNELLNSQMLSDRAVMIIDDEADAASLNTLVNQDDEERSRINEHITAIRKAGASCIYLQVTATPQAVLLQTKQSDFKPSFVVYFKPGQQYLGGDSFFSRPKPYCIIEADEEEILSVTDPESTDDFWLNRAILNFLVVCAQFNLTGYSTVCNFLIHPSVRTRDHETVATKVGQILNDILQSITDNDTVIADRIKAERDNLYSTKPEIRLLDDIYSEIRELLFEQKIKVRTLNSRTDVSVNFEDGFNIVIGGNILGRGITFPNLQTVYYSRFAKKPQADTYWQHCRMFGYDRDRGLIRLFMPLRIFQVFQELNDSQKVIVKQICNGKIDNIQLVYAPNISPTRRAVIDTDANIEIRGGVNYAAFYPVNESLEELDKLLLPYSYSQSNWNDVDIDVIVQVLSLIGSDPDEDAWNPKEDFVAAIKNVGEKQGLKKAKLFVSVGREISRGKGTMISEQDRLAINRYTDEIALIMYRLTGTVENGWSGQPLWMPNVKLPEAVKVVFMQTD